jgi:hypothetical protein
VRFIPASAMDPESTQQQLSVGCFPGAIGAPSAVVFCSDAVLRWISGPLVMIRQAVTTTTRQRPTRARFTCCGRWRSMLMSDLLLSLSFRLQFALTISQSQCMAWRWRPMVGPTKRGSALCLRVVTTYEQDLQRDATTRMTRNTRLNR